MNTLLPVVAVRLWRTEAPVSFSVAFEFTVRTPVMVTPLPMVHVAPLGTVTFPYVPGASVLVQLVVPPATSWPKNEVRVTPLHAARPAMSIAPAITGSRRNVRPFMPSSLRPDQLHVLVPRAVLPPPTNAVLPEHAASPPT